MEIEKMKIAPGGPFMSTYGMGHPARDPDIVKGLLQPKELMLLTAREKAGKSFLLMELAVAVVSGGKWLDHFRCHRAPVLYVNMELKDRSIRRRFYDIGSTLGLSGLYGLKIANLRGESVNLKDLEKRLIATIEYTGVSVVIIDPIYKLLTGADENSAANINKVLTVLWRIASKTGAAIIFSHYRDGEATCAEDVSDQESSAGIFARAVDTFVDINEIPSDQPYAMPAGWRMTFMLRNQPPRKPIDLYWNYPIHTWDRDGELAKRILEDSGDGEP